MCWFMPPTPTRHIVSLAATGSSASGRERMPGTRPGEYFTSLCASRRIRGSCRGRGCDRGSRLRFAELRYDVGIEQQTSHRLTSRSGDLTVIRSKFTPASGNVANAATISRPEIGRRMRSNSSARTITTASRPCSVTRCGPRCWAGSGVLKMATRPWWCASLPTSKRLYKLFKGRVSTTAYQSFIGSDE